MAAALEYPFTMAQWRELERQAMIYKYMMASVPVPHHLLSPLPNLPDPSASAAVFLSPYYGAGGGGDPEIGRCRRTDGKKWRCAKAVAPNQKYCERHLNRGRSRSRKPVESLNGKCRLQHHRYPLLPSTATSTAMVDLPSNSIPLPSPFLKPVPQPRHLQELPPSSSLVVPTIYSASSFRDPRNPNWAVKEGRDLLMLTPNQQWQGAACGGANSNGPLFSHRHYQEVRPGPNASGDFGAGQTKQENGGLPLFLSPELLPSEKSVMSGTPIIEFIDAWSNNPAIDAAGTVTHESSVSSSNARLELSDLTLSMALIGGDLIDQEMGRIEMGRGSTDSDLIEHGSSIPQPGLSRLPNQAPWVVGPSPGGPLAEVLRPGNFSSGGTRGISATAASSPSGVIQKAVSSLSDSSGSCSPTLATSKASQEIDFPWFCQH